MKILRMTALCAALALSAQAAAASEPPRSHGVAKEAQQPELYKPATSEAAVTVLSDAQMDGISAGDLGLPNGKVVFGGFDNPAPDVDGYFGLCNEGAGFAFCHPSLTRRSQQVLIAQGENYNGPTGLSGVNEGAWSAAFKSPVIDLVGLDL